MKRTNSSLACHHFDRNTLAFSTVGRTRIAVSKAHVCPRFQKRGLRSECHARAYTATARLSSVRQPVSPVPGGWGCRFTCAFRAQVTVTVPAFHFRPKSGSCALHPYRCPISFGWRVGRDPKVLRMILVKAWLQFAVPAAAITQPESQNLVAPTERKRFQET